MIKLPVIYILKHLIDKLGSKDENLGYLKISVQKGEMREKPICSLKETMINFKKQTTYLIQKMAQ